MWPDSIGTDRLVLAPSMAAPTPATVNVLGTSPGAANGLGFIGGRMTVPVHVKVSTDTCEYEALVTDEAVRSDTTFMVRTHPQRHSTSAPRHATPHLPASPSPRVVSCGELGELRRARMRAVRSSVLRFP
jgi:hypothetical protein